MTESELFGRFLDAPLRSDIRSELIRPSPSEGSAEQQFLRDYYAGYESVSIDYDFPERLLNEVHNHPLPSFELGAVIADLKAMLNGLQMLEREFGDLAECTPP